MSTLYKMLTFGCGLTLTYIMGVSAININALDHHYVGANIDPSLMPYFSTIVAFVSIGIMILATCEGYINPHKNRLWRNKTNIYTTLTMCGIIFLLLADLGSTFMLVAALGILFTISLLSGLLYTRCINSIVDKRKEQSENKERV